MDHDEEEEIDGWKGQPDIEEGPGGKTEILVLLTEDSPSFTPSFLHLFSLL